MIRFFMTEINTYLEEIVNALDFESLNEFLNEHMRIKMDVTELIREISINGLEALNKENITQLLNSVNQSEAVGATVADKMNELMENTKKMNSIQRVVTKLSTISQRMTISHFGINW